MTASPEPTTKGLVIRWAGRYDLLAWILTRGRERELRKRMIDLARIQPGDAVLDIGCGTGTLAILAARRAGPSGSVVGVDASGPMIARAAHKAAKAGVPVTFELAAAEHLPFSDHRFDVVLSTLMLHHLPRTTRQQCALEIRRVLMPGGRVLAVDFGGRQHTGLMAHFHRHGHVAVDDIVSLLEDAGLRAVSKGAVGMNDLHFVLAQAPGGTPPAAVDDSTTVPGQPHHERSWRLGAVSAALVGAPVLLYYFLPIAGVPAAATASLAAIVALKHAGVLAAILAPLYALRGRRLRR